MFNIQEMTIDAKKTFDKYIDHKYENSSSSFANLFIWRNSFDTKYAIIDDFLVLFYQSKRGTIHCTMPYGNGNIECVMIKLKEFLQSINQEFIIEAVTEEKKDLLISLYDDKLEYREERSMFDYVYLQDDLSNLSGKKLHSKRNHINKFESLYNYKYTNLTPNLFDKCITSAQKWLLSKYEETDVDYIGEITSIKEAFKYFDNLELSGGVLLVDDEVAAFTIGERLTHNMALIHIEKADISYQGAFAMINREYVRHKWSDMKYINREEDLGIEGLRKAKLSYNPCKFVKLYTCKLNLGDI